MDWLPFALRYGYELMEAMEWNTVVWMGMTPISSCILNTCSPVGITNLEGLGSVALLKGVSLGVVFELSINHGIPVSSPAHCLELVDQM